MTNKEMEQIQNAITLLTTLQDHAIHSETFMNDTGITICTITKCINSLREIHLKEAITKARYRKQANEWNKAHPERHREYNKEWARQNRAKKGGRGQCPEQTLTQI